MGDFKKIDETTGRVSYDKAFTRQLVGNGPYNMVSWQFKRGVRFEANPHYWDRAHVKSRVIYMLSADDPLAAFLKYDSGAVDWQAEITGDIAAELHRVHRPDLHVFPSFGTYFYSVNCRPKLPDGRDNPLADARIRQALTMSVDKRAIVETITRLGEAPADKYIPPGIFAHFESPPGMGFDIPRAQKLLADAGYPGGRGFPQLSLLYNNEANHGDIAQNVRRQWIDNLGIDFKPEPVEIKTFRERLHKKDYAIARASWFGDYNDVSTFTDKYLSNSENNDSDWQNARYDQLCAQAEVEPDADKRLRLLEQAENLINTELPIIPIYYYVNSYLFRENVKGLPMNVRNMVNFKSIYVER
jgi:oligopeptide transport system substrate-binding protein